MRMLRFSILMLAFACFTGALFAQDDISEALYSEGLRSYVLKDYKAALKNFESLYQLDPDDVKSREMLVNTLLALGDAAYEDSNLGKAETYYLKAKAISPSNTESQGRLDVVKAAWARQMDQEAADSAAQNQEAASTDEPTQPAQAPIIIQTPPSEDSGAVLALLEGLLSRQEGDLERLNDQQKNDRELFLRSILIGFGIFLGAILLIILIVVLITKNRRTTTVPLQSTGNAYPGDYMALSMDEGEYLTDERHSDVVRAKRLTELAGKLNRGEDSWETVKDYVGELNVDLKKEILSIVEKQLSSEKQPDDEAVMSVLLPLVTDSSEEIGNQSQGIIAGLSGGSETSHPRVTYECDDTDPADPLSYDSLLQLARLVDAKTGRPDHSVKVGDLSREIALHLGLPELDPNLVRRAGLAFDVGFLEIPDDLMKKEGTFNKKEMATMRSHTERGPQLLEHSDPPEEFLTAMTMHHERLDGSGYPEGLSGDEIPMIARIVGAADMFCAATSVRTYHKPLSVEACLEILRGLSGKQLDTDVINALVEIFEETEAGA